MRKNLDVSDKTVKILTEEAESMQPKSVFKLLAQSILDEAAKKIERKKSK